MKPRWEIALALLVLLIFGLLVWQLITVSPDVCSKVGEKCLLGIIGVKDHAIMGLLGIVAFMIVPVAVVASRVHIKGSGPMGVGIDIGSSSP